MKIVSFEWDENKNWLNQKKHSDDEERFYCFGKVDDNIISVRFTYRDKRIRIIGAGHWRKGKQIYEKENKI